MAELPRSAPIAAAVICALACACAAAVALGLDRAAPSAFGIAGVGLTAGLVAQVGLQRARLGGLATADALTGLTNHRGFHERLAATLSAAHRERVPVSVVVLDLDDFDLVNQVHGYPFGDSTLRAAAAQLRGVLRTGDLAARIGGEEFGLILPGVDGVQALAVAERARAALTSVPARGLELTCSAGIASCPADSDHASVLYRLSETALHWAKSGGKDRARHFNAGHTPGDWSARQRAEVEAILASEEPVRVVFQPIVALATGRVVGYEALSRFPNTSRSSPLGWFAQAHGCGLGAELEAAAIRAALEPDRRPLDAHLAINVSPSALSSDAVRDALPGDLTGIVIEVTEHEFVADDDDALAATIVDLRRRGARVAIDDAGAGHAGLKQLMRLRPDIVKLDRGLTDRIHEDVARTALIESFVRFAGQIGAIVCAEGIESLEDLAAIADLDVEWGQGYVFAHPASPWTGISPLAEDVCRSALEQALQAIPSDPRAVAAGDRRLVDLSSHLARTRSREELGWALAIIAEEVGAHALVLSRWDPDSGTIETVATSGEPAPEREYSLADYPLTARVLHDHDAVQVYVGDPDGDPAETRLLLDLGKRSLLMVPIVSAGGSVGLLEAQSREDRPWTRAQINRTRVVANQLPSVMRALDGFAVAAG